MTVKVKFKQNCETNMFDKCFNKLSRKETIIIMKLYGQEQLYGQDDRTVRNVRVCTKCV